MVGFTCVKSMSKPMKVYQVKKCFSKTCIKLLYSGICQQKELDESIQGPEIICYHCRTCKTISTAFRIY